MTTAAAPFIAAERIREEEVISFPGCKNAAQGRISLQQNVMSKHSIPVALRSSLAQRGSEPALEALEAGVVRSIQKRGWGPNSSWGSQGSVSVMR
jgi:chemotaxis response regulator CheB